MATTKQVTPFPPATPHRFVVGIYCRVSSESQSQLVSVAHQMSGLITNVANSNLAKLYDVYLDVQSGRSADNRRNLMRLLNDCRSGKIRIVEEEKARQRKSRKYREEAESQPDGVVRPTHSGDITKGRARDAVAKSVGLGSGRQLERAEYLAKNRPDLLKKVDRGETTIYGAYNAAKNENGALGIEISEEKKDSTAEYAAPVNAEAPVYVGPDHPEMWKRLEAYNPGFERNTGSGIKGASHIKLLENHIYATLYEKYAEKGGVLIGFESR